MLMPRSAVRAMPGLPMIDAIASCSSMFSSHASADLKLSPLDLHARFLLSTESDLAVLCWGAGNQALQPSSKATPAHMSAPADAVLHAVGQYDPSSMACWPRGAPTPYLHVARALRAMDSTAKRLSIGDALTNMFRSVLALSPGLSP